VGDAIIGTLTVWREDERESVAFIDKEAELIRRFATPVSGSACSNKR
jgi:hypothetical protein